MWRDGHVIGGQGIAYFPESGKLYALPPETAAGLADWLAGRGEPPAAAAENFAVVFPAPIWYNAVDRN